MAGKISSKASNVFCFGKKTKKHPHGSSTGWPGIIKISFFNPKKRITDNQTPTAEVRDGLGLQLSNSNCERRFAVQREKTNS